MKQSEKRNIYDILSRSFVVGEAYPLSKIGNCLAEHGVSPSDYGFKKTKELFIELSDYMEMHDVAIGMHMHPYVRLRLINEIPAEVEVEYADEEAVEEAVEAVQTEDIQTEEVKTETVQLEEQMSEEVPSGSVTDEKNEEAAELPDWISQPRYVVIPKDELPKKDVSSDQTENSEVSGSAESAEAEEGKPKDESGENDPYPHLPKTMEGGIYLAPKTLGKLNYFLTGVEEQPDEEVIKVLCQSYNTARAEGKLLYKNEAYRFRVALKSANGDDMVAAIKPSSYSGPNPNAHKWYLNFAGTMKAPGLNMKPSPGKTLEQFAFLGSWANFLENLAGKALKENWDFSAGDEKKYDILQKYIQYTFFRMQLEDKICIDEVSGFAAFNTGLVNVHYDDIYACFEMSDGEHETSWRFVDFCTAASRGLGKRLVEVFNPLPQPPKYFERKEDLFYDLDKELHCDFDHIIVDNISRFPIGFLKEECRDFPEAMEILQGMDEGMRYPERKTALKTLSEVIEDNPRLFNRLRHRIEDAIGLAKKQVRWNFKTAVPCYFPTRNVMSLMLPLDLEEDGVTDAALVVELTRSGNYQGQTVLTLQQAYLDARLLCRPNNEWLSPQNIPMGEELEEE